MKYTKGDLGEDILLLLLVLIVFYSILVVGHQVIDATNKELNKQHVSPNDTSRSHSSARGANETSGLNERVNWVKPRGKDCKPSPVIKCSSGRVV